MQALFEKTLLSRKRADISSALAILLVLACTSKEAQHETTRSAYLAQRQCSVGKRLPDKILFGIVGFWGWQSETEAFEPVAQYLWEKLGLEVVLVRAASYDDLAESVVSKRLEMALLPPVAYVKAKEREPCLRLLRTMVVKGKLHYSGYIVVRSDSQISRPEDLVGKRIVFVEPSSASGFLVAKAWLSSHGIVPENSVFLGGHDAVIKAVLDGDADAGATFHGALERARRTGLDTGALRVLAITGRIPMDAVVASHDLDEGLVDRLQQAFDGLNTTNPEGRQALSRLLEISGFARTDEKLYEELLQLVRLEKSGAGP